MDGGQADGKQQGDRAHEGSSTPRIRRPYRIVDRQGNEACARETRPPHQLTPASAIPAAYFAFAHATLATALAVLAVRPDVPGGFFYHPRMIALVHLVTVGWLSGSILGAFYIVGPLALRLPMPVRRSDWLAFAFFASGAIGMSAHFWIGEYDGVAWSGAVVTAAIAWVGGRACLGLGRAVAPWGVKLHVALAFTNAVAAAVLGAVMGFDRSRGFLDGPAFASTAAHAHIAAVGWPTMMVVGLSYRLIPMMLPAAMPTGASLAASAVLIESGLLLLVAALLASGPAWPGALLIVTGLASFVVQVRRMLGRRVPKPPALPRRDWSTWQTHVALLWLVVAAALGIVSSLGLRTSWSAAALWWYGIAGLIGFLSQIVVGIQGRLVPMYAWYRAAAANGGHPPEQSAHELPSPAFARLVFLAWTAGVPLLGLGLVLDRPPLIRGGAAILLAGVMAGAGHLRHMLRAR